MSIYTKIEVLFLSIVASLMILLSSYGNRLMKVDMTIFIAILLCFFGIILVELIKYNGNWRKMIFEDEDDE